MTMEIGKTVRTCLSGVALAAIVAVPGVGVSHAQSADAQAALEKDAEFLNSVLASYIRSQVYNDPAYGTAAANITADDLVIGLEDAIDWTMEYLKEVRLLERIERNNALLVLEGIAMGAGADLAETHGADEGFQDTVDYLVSEGVVGTIGSDLASAQVTLTGCRAVRRYNDNTGYPGCDRFHPDDTWPMSMPEYYPISAPIYDGGASHDFTNMELVLRDANLGGLVEIDPAVDMPFVWTEEVGGEQQVIRLDIAASAEPTTYFLRTLAEPGIDPVMTIYYGDPSYYAGDVVVPTDSQYLYFDDDSLPEFNSEVIFDHYEATTYWIVLSEYAGLYGSVEMTLSDESFAMIPVETEIQQANDFSADVQSQLLAEDSFRVETTAVLDGTNQVVQFTLPDMDGSRTVYAWTEALGIDPVAELYVAEFVADETMSVPLRPGDVIAAGDDGPPPLDLNPIVEFQHTAAGTYWLNLSEYWGESGSLTVVISDTPPW